MRTTVKRLAALADRVAPPRPGVTVLAYHRVGGQSDSAVDLPVDVFEWQIRMLRDEHDILTLDAALGRLAADDPTPGVVVTFDDGTSDFTDHALPVLAAHGVPATLYVATWFVDAGRPFPWGAPPISWAALREAAGSGLVTLGSHTHRHLLLDRVPGGEAAADIDRSIELLGEHTGHPPAHFAYPKAVRGRPPAEIAVRRRFLSAALAGGGVNRPGSDPFQLARVPIQRGDHPDWFSAKVRGGLRLEGALRSAANRVRYRGSAS